MADVKKIIKDIEDKDLSGSNEQQGAFAEMIKGLAFSDDPLSNKFMKKVDTAITKIAKEILKQEESVVIEITEDVKLPGTNIMLEKGDKIQVLNEIDMSKYYDIVVKIVQDIFNKEGVNADAEDYVYNLDRLVISAEDRYSYLLADYYGEYRGGYAYINPELRDKLAKYDLFAEWQDPGTITVWEM